MITDRETGWTEPSVTINGHALTFAQAMSLRVAVSSFRMFLAVEHHQQQLGGRLAESYDAHLAQLERFMRSTGAEP